MVKHPITGYYHYVRYDNTGQVSPSKLLAGIDDDSSGMARLRQENEQALRAWWAQESDLVSRSPGRAATIMNMPDSLIVILKVLAIRRAGESGMISGAASAKGSIGYAFGW